MKKIILPLSLLITTIFFTACSAEPETNTNINQKIIKLTTSNNDIITLELNNSPAANDLYNQLPLSIDLEDYSTNEKIFYPPNKLNTESTPKATPKIGTLAYYEPWGDVVIFYDDFRANNDLYELGHVISGGDIVSELSGTVTIEAMPNQ